MYVLRQYFFFVIGSFSVLLVIGVCVWFWFCVEVSYLISSCVIHLTERDKVCYKDFTLIVVLLLYTRCMCLKTFSHSNVVDLLSVNVVLSGHAHLLRCLYICISNTVAQ